MHLVQDFGEEEQTKVDIVACSEMTSWRSGGEVSHSGVGGAAPGAKYITTKYT